jgi:hypothetical protein
VDLSGNAPELALLPGDRYRRDYRHKLHGLWTVHDGHSLATPCGIHEIAKPGSSFVEGNMEHDLALKGVDLRTAKSPHRVAKMHTTQDR